MRVVTRAEQILELILVEHLVHRYGKDVLFGHFVVTREVVCVVRLQLIAIVSQQVTIVYASFPGVFFTIGCVERHCRAIRLSARCPVVIAIYLSIEVEFSQQEISHRARHASVVVALQAAVVIGEIGNSLLKLTDDEPEHLAALALSDPTYVCVAA